MSRLEMVKEEFNNALKRVLNLFDKWNNVIRSCGKLFCQRRKREGV